MELGVACVHVMGEICFPGAYVVFSVVALHLIINAALKKWSHAAEELWTERVLSQQDMSLNL